MRTLISLSLVGALTLLCVGTAWADQPSTKPNANGSLDKRIIRKVVSQNTKAIKACYERGLASSPELQGKVVVSFVIDASGAVASASVKSVSDEALTTSGVAACVVESVKTWTFPEPQGEGDVMVSYPFLFERGLGAETSATEPSADDTPKDEPTAEVPDAADGPVVQGELDRALIRRVVKRKQNDVRACYEDALRANPELAGTVAVQWTIGSDGQVARASVASATPETLLETDLDACLVQGVKTWVFPAPKAGEVQVIYPFVFATE